VVQLELVLGATEEYNGSTWVTSPGSMNTARQGLAGSVNGTQTAALGFGGNTPPYTGATEQYDGTSWTTVATSIATARGQLGGAGTQASALAFAGDTGPGGTTATEEFTGAGAAVTKTITVS
jgi:hypothetical protein